MIVRQQIERHRGNLVEQYPLLWMIDEAVKCGLKVDTRTVNALAWGRQRKASPFHYVAPDVAAKAHQSLHGAWWILEFVPKAAKYKQWPARKVHFGYYIPDAEPRPIPEDALIHESVVQRMEAVKDYRPVNLPVRYQTFPMPQAPEPVVAAGG